MMHLPTVIGLLVCEQVIVDKDTNNPEPHQLLYQEEHSFVSIHAQRFAVVAFMTEGMGDVPIELTIQRRDNLDVIKHYAMSVAFTHMLQEVRFVLRVSDCVFPVAGKYDIFLLTDDAVLAQHRIDVG
jgi:hypothetical protein